MTENGVYALVLVFILGKLYDVAKDVRNRRNGVNTKGEQDMLCRRLDAIDAGILRLWERTDKNVESIADLRVSIGKCQAFHKERGS